MKGKKILAKPGRPPRSTAGAHTATIQLFVNFTNRSQQEGELNLRLLREVFRPRCSYNLRGVGRGV
jgi:hypothetical protein